jgi:hypothetical protein
LCGSFTDVEHWLSDDGKRGIGNGCPWMIVKADKAYVSGTVEAELVECQQRAETQEVVADEQRLWTIGL